MGFRHARRFGLTDAMILLAATAVGLAWGRHHWHSALLATDMPPSVSHRMRHATRSVEFAYRVWDFTRAASRCLACWLLALLALRLRPPRPRRARLLRPPGMLAAAMATAYTMAIAIGFLLAFLIRSRYKPSWSDYAGQAIDPHATAQAISAAWLVLAASGRWRPEPTWIDRLGLLIGSGWIALSAAGNTFDWR